MSEEWRLCFGGAYSVSSAGRVRRERAASATRAGFILTPRRSGWGTYPTVNLKADGSKGQTFYVHRLVAEAFLGPRPNGMEVNHKNGDKGDPSAQNLEYVTHSENKKHAFRTGLQKPSCGSINGHAKLTESDVVAIRRQRDEGASLAALSVLFGVSKSIIWRIEKRQIWRHV